MLFSSKEHWAHPEVTNDAAQTLVNTLVTSRLDGLNALLIGVPQTTVALLQRVQNNAARVVTGTPKHDHISPILRSLHWLPVATRIKFKVLLLAYKCVHGIAPPYLQELIQPYRPSRSLRSAEGLLLSQPRSRLASFGDRAFSRAAPRLWNSLPYTIRASDSVAIFKRRLKTHMILS